VGKKKIASEILFSSKGKREEKKDRERDAGYEKEGKKNGGTCAGITDSMKKKKICVLKGRERGLEALGRKGKRETSYPELSIEKERQAIGSIFHTGKGRGVESSTVNYLGKLTRRG